MRYLPIILLCAAPFVLAAVVLVLVERMRPGRDDPLFVHLTSLGFTLAAERWMGHERQRQYVNGNVEVRTLWDGAPTEVVDIVVGVRTTQIWNLEIDAVARLLQEHPEILRGDFSAAEPFNTPPSIG
jgi:hypothetical protein